MARTRTGGQALTDVSYQFKSLFGAKAEHTGRLAVIYPLVRPGPGAKRAELMAAGVRTLGLWRHRLYDWGQKGWMFANSPASVARMRNCPPSLYSTAVSDADKARDERVVPCRRWGFCPWCHGRRVVELYHTVAGNVINSGEQLLFAVGRQKLDSRRSLVQCLDEHQDRLVRLFRGNVPSLSRVGGYYTVTAEPHGGCWLVCSRLLVLFQLDERFELIPRGWKVKRWPRPSEDDTVSAVARVGRYPSGLLLGDVTRAAEVIKAREDLKLSNYVGVFRGAKADLRAGVSAGAVKPKKPGKPPAQPSQPSPQPQSGQPAADKKPKKKYSVPSWFTAEN